jgi:hypothetical protein
LTKTKEGKKSEGYGFHHCHSENSRKKVNCVCERKSENLQGMCLAGSEGELALYKVAIHPSILHIPPNQPHFPCCASLGRGANAFWPLNLFHTTPLPRPSMFITAQFLATNKILTDCQNGMGLARRKLRPILVVKSTKNIVE